MNTPSLLIRLACALALSLPAMAQAQAQAQAQHAGHATTPAAASACPPEHAAMGHCTPAPAEDTHAHHAATEPASTPDCTPEHAAMGHCTLSPPEGQHAVHNADDASGCTPEHAAMGHCSLPVDDPCTAEHAAMGHCTPKRPAPLEPLEPIPPITDADRAAAFPELKHHHMSHGPAYYTRVLFNRFEAWDGDHGNGQAWEGSAFIGGNIHRLWLLSSGERESGSTASSSMDVLYGRGITPWWDVVAGVRQDFRPAESQTRAAVGVQGMAPYFFEISAMLYLDESGRLTASTEVEYEMLLTNRLILQPLLELEFNSKSDPSRHIGSGLGKVEAGVRLRYELDRKFAPYIGFVHERAMGGTADFHRQNGESPRDNRWVAGVRFWF